MTSEHELAAMYGHTGRMALSTAIHLLGWLCKGIGNWIAFRLLGSDIDFMEALAIEALLHALLIPAFVVPGYAGVQEAGYAGIGALFGIPPEISLGVSLLRRARDIAIGTPILLVWQLVEMRRLRDPRRFSAQDGYVVGAPGIEPCSPDGTLQTVTGGRVNCRWLRALTATERLFGKGGCEPALIDYP